MKNKRIGSIIGLVGIFIAVKTVAAGLVAHGTPRVWFSVPALEEAAKLQKYVDYVAGDAVSQTISHRVRTSHDIYNERAKWATERSFDPHTPLVNMDAINPHLYASSGAPHQGVGTQPMSIGVPTTPSASAAVLPVQNSIAFLPARAFSVLSNGLVPSGVNGQGYRTGCESLPVARIRGSLRPFTTP